MEWAYRVAHWNKQYPQYPPTIYSHDWVYGVWYCGTSFTRSTLYGQYPPTFLKRALTLFPDAKQIIQCPSGQLTGPGVTVDLFRDNVRCPRVVANVTALPFANGVFDLYLSDPPYSKDDCIRYGVKSYPLGRAMKEAHRVLCVGGHFGLLHTMYPSYRRRDGWALKALIAVVTGFSRRTRMFSIFEKTA